MCLGLKSQSSYLTVLILLLVILLNLIVSSWFLRLDNFIHGDLYDYGLVFSYEWAEEVWYNNKMVWTSLLMATTLTIASIIPHYSLRNKHRRLSKWTGFLLPALAFMFQGFSIYFLDKMNNIVWSGLYSYGVQYDIDWSVTYNPISMPTLALMVTAFIALIIPAAKAIAATETRVTRPFMEQKKRRRLGWRALTSVAFRYIPRHKLRNAFTVLTIIIGVALIIGVNVTFDSVLGQFEFTTRKATGNIDIVITSLEDTFNSSILSEVKTVDGILNASARLSRTAEIGVENQTVTIIGVDSRNDFAFMDLNITEQASSPDGLFEFETNSSGALLHESFEFTLGQLFDVRFYNETSFVKTGELPSLNQTDAFEFEVVGIYRHGEREGGEGIIYVDLMTIQEICGLRDKVDSIIVKITEIDVTDQVVADLNLKLDSEFIVNPIKKDLLEAITETTSGLSLGLQIVSFLALCVSIIVVLNSMYMNVGEKTREIGVLRSIGSSTGQVFWLFFSQSFILGALGASLGMGAGLILNSIFKQLINFFSDSILSPQEVATFFSVSYLPYMVMGAIAGVVATLIGGVFPSTSASRVDIIKSLRPTMRKAGKQRTALKLIGLGLPLSLFGVLEYLGVISYGDAGWGILLVSLLVPVIGVILLTAGLLRVTSRGLEYLLFMFRSGRKVITRNIDRNLLKSTACFTMIGLSLSFLVVVGGAQTGVVTGIEDVIKSYVSSDLTVVSETSLSRYFAENLTKLDGGNLISDATPAFIIPTEIVLLNNASDTKTTVTVVAIDPDTYPDVMPMTFNKDTPTDVFERLNMSGNIVLTAPLALSLNVSVNDELKIPMVSVVEVPIEIPNQFINGSIPDIPDYDGVIPDDLVLPVDVPDSTTVYVPQIQITYENFTVVGISEGAWLRAASFGSLQLSKTCYISYNSLNDTFPDFHNNATIFFAAATSSQDVERAREQILNSFETEYDLDVVTRDEVLNDVAEEIDKIFLSLYIPVLFASLNAIIGVLSIMIINVNSRRREIGILRSQGMSRSQVVSSIIGEVLVLGIVGFVIAVGLGLIFQSIVVAFMNLGGFMMPFTISLDSIQLALVEAIVISVISAAYPAYKAAKLNIVESLRQ